MWLNVLLTKIWVNVFYGKKSFRSRKKLKYFSHKWYKFFGLGGWFWLQKGKYLMTISHQIKTVQWTRTLLTNHPTTSSQNSNFSPSMWFAVLLYDFKTKIRRKNARGGENWQQTWTNKSFYVIFCTWLCTRSRCWCRPRERDKLCSSIHGWLCGRLTLSLKALRQTIIDNYFYIHIFHGKQNENRQT